jgi:hypothetical protein
MKEQAIEDWLRRAYSPGVDCPPPETYLDDSLKRLSTEEKERVFEHAARCPACAVERELAQVYDASPDEMQASRADVDFVVSRLSSPLSEEGNVVSLEGARPRPKPRPAGRWGWAAAAVFVLAVVGTITMLRTPAPSLPTRTVDPVMRGGRVEVTAPVGTLDAMPQTLSWKETRGAAIYRVRVLMVDDTVLSEYTVTNPYVELPEGLLTQLHPAVTYFWEVEALDSSEARLAWSDRVEFRVKPSGGPE